MPTTATPPDPARRPAAVPPSAGFRRLAVSAAVMALVVIAVGGATRATGSGLACPTWPGCFTGGDFLPPLSGEWVDGLGRTVTGLNVWLEHSHRLLAGILGLQVAALLVWVLARHRRVPGLLWSTVAAAVMVNVQALLGALVVWNLVRADLVTLHLGLGTATMALLVYLAVRAGGPLATPTAAGRRRLLRFAVIATGVLWAQILVGGHLSGLHGGLAFKADPLLGVLSVGPITVEAEAFNVAHRAMAFVVAALIGILSARVRRAGITGPARRWARAAVHLTGVQILLGVANLYSDLSFVTTIPHLVVASWILAAMVLTCLHLAEGREAATDVEPAEHDPALEPVA